MPKLRPLGKREKLEYKDAPVRRCGPECFFFKNGGKGCQFYQQEDVKFEEICMHDVVKLKEYADAFSSGKTDIIKRDASQITASIIIQIQNMSHQILLEGHTVEEPIMDGKGNPIWIPDPNWNERSGREREMVVLMRKKEHPLIAKVIQLCKSMGLNLTEFKQTPKSADEKLAVAGHIVVDEQTDLNKVMEERKIEEDRFLVALDKGDTMLENDPVYQKLLEQGDIIDG